MPPNLQEEVMAVKREIAPPWEKPPELSQREVQEFMKYMKSYQ